MRILLTLILLVLFSNSTVANTITQKLDNAILELSQNQAMLKTIAKKRGFKGAQITVVVEHMASILGNPTVRRIIVKNISKKWKTIKKSKFRKAEYHKAGLLAADEFSNLVILGLPRLSYTAQRDFWIVMAPVYEKASIKDCAFFANGGGTLEQNDAAELRSLIKLTASELGALYSFTRAAFEMQISKRGRIKKLTKSQKAKVDDGLGMQMLSNIAKHKNRIGIEAYFDGTSKRGKDTCDALKLTLLSTMQLKGKLGKWAAVYMISSI